MSLLRPRLEAIPSHGGYIPGIEGMRALAVLVVLFFHLDIHTLSGGFLGVDLFFVISGFIITRNILADLGNQTFSLKEFYVRRFRRLFPALLVTVLLTVFFSIGLLPPAELANAAESAIFALFSLANIHFWLESGYFDAAADAKPLLHTWSLSVEEQFYLFWPALLLILANTRRRLVIVSLLLVVSLMASMLWRDDYPSAIFYLLPFRLHQLMAGAVVAILALRLSGFWGSLVILLASIGFILTTVMLDGRYSPAVGAAMTSGFGFLLLLARDAPLARFCYDNNFMQWVGRRSYAIYLVHWPMVVLYKFATDFQLDNIGRVILFCLTFVAAVMLHELVEKPFRKRGEDTTKTQRYALPTVSAILLVAVIVNAAIWHLDGFKEQSDRRIQQTIDSVVLEKDKRRQAIRFGQCNLHEQHTFADYDIEACATTESERRNVLIIGDSMAADTYMMFAQAFPEVHFLQATAGACTAVREISDVGGKYATCRELNEYRFSELLDRDLDLVILASIWSQDRIQPLQETVEYLRSRGRRVLVVGPRAVFRASVPLLVSRQASLGEANQRLRDQIVMKDTLLEQMKIAMPGVEIIDIGKIQCTPQCDALEGGQLLYYDGMHFTELGARRMGERLRESFDLTGFISSPVQ